MKKHSSTMLYQDSIGWDIENWLQGVKFWLDNVEFKNKRILELGCGCDNGGLSLLAANQKADSILCTNFGDITETTKNFHKQYKTDNIDYANIDALDIPYNEEFDIIMFKSMMGGITKLNPDNTDIILKNCAKALKKSGKLIFAENLTSTRFHMWCRRKLNKRTWHYFQPNELEEHINSIGSFNIIDKMECGILGCFGRNEKQRRLLSKLDRILEKFCPRDFFYIQFWILEKK